MKKDDKTIYDSGETLYDTGATVPDSNGTVLDDPVYGGATVYDGTETSPQAEKDADMEKGSTLLNTYRIECDAIEGGMGKVWRVHHNGWNVDLAMKQPKAALFQTEKQKENFITECEAWINLGLHPHIVSCYYVREIGGIPTIFSEWMDGGSLKNIIEDGSLYGGSQAEQQERILDISIQFARGLQYAHEQGLIHQDVKPDNLLLNKNGEAKVADFGIAKARAELTVLDTNMPSDKTMFSQSGGYTPAYCSMEQMNDQKLTRRTDIYSWAVSVMEMYLGDRPWTNGVIAGAACESYFKDAKVAIPEDMKTLLKECLDKDEADRPHDFEVVEKNLLAIYKGTAGSEYGRTSPKAAADTSDSLNNRALSFLDMGRQEEAKRCWKKALEIDPKHKESIYNQIIQRWHTAEIDDLYALEYCRTEIPEYEDGVAAICTERGEYKVIKINLAIQPPFKYTSNADGSQLVTWLGNRVRLYLTDTGECIEEFSHDENVINTELSEDMSYVLCYEENHVSIWDMHTKNRVFRGQDIKAGRLSPDGRYLACIMEKACTAVYEVRTGKLQCLIRHQPFLNAKRWFANNHLIALDTTGLYSQYGSFSLFDCRTGEKKRTFTWQEGHKWRNGKVTAIDFSIGKDYIVAGGNDQKIWLWDAHTGQCLRVYEDKRYRKSYHDSIDFVSFSNHNRQIVSLTSNSVFHIWDAAAGRIHFTDRNFGADVENKNHIQKTSGGFIRKQEGNLYFIRYPQPGQKAPYRLCRIQSTDMRIEQDKLFLNLLIEAENLLEIGNIGQALLRIKEAREIHGYENDRRGIELSQRIGAYCKRIGLKNILLHDTWKDENSLPDVAAGNDLLYKADKACVEIKQRLEKALRGYGTNSAYSYSTNLLDCIESPDRSLWACLIAVREEYDSPAQYEVEVTIKYSIVLCDAAKELPVLCCRDITTDHETGTRYSLSMAFSPSGDKLLVARENLKVINLLACEHCDDCTGLPGVHAVKIYPEGNDVVDIQYARYTPDEGFILMRCKNDNMVLIDANKHEELFATCVVDSEVRGMELSADGNAYTLRVGKKGHRLYTLDWEYEYSGNEENH